MSGCSHRNISGNRWRSTGAGRDGQNPRWRGVSVRQFWPVRERVPTERSP
jgi:hypothetical protein